MTDRDPPGAPRSPAGEAIVRLAEDRLGPADPLTEQIRAVADQRDRLAAEADNLAGQRDLVRAEAAAWKRVAEALYPEAGWRLEAVNALYARKLDELRRCRGE